MTKSGMYLFKSLNDIGSSKIKATIDIKPMSPLIIMFIQLNWKIKDNVIIIKTVKIITFAISSILGEKSLSNKTKHGKTESINIGFKSINEAVDTALSETLEMKTRAQYKT